MTSDILDLLDPKTADPTITLVNRFKTKYGSIIHTIKNGDDVAKVGKLSDQDIFIVFYPGGEYDRFEDKPVVYRDGWEGPKLPDAIRKKTKTKDIKVEVSFELIKAEMKKPRIRKAVPKKASKSTSSKVKH